jgi:hypothetical protein
MPVAATTMTKKKKPTGFIAKCQCGLNVGAMDYINTDKAEAGRILGKWLHDGCTVIPMFDSSWQVTCSPCECEVLAVVEVRG